MSLKSANIYRTEWNCNNNCRIKQRMQSFEEMLTGAMNKYVWLQIRLI